MPPERRPRVYVDTNVLVSGLYSRAGSPAAILNLHSDDKLVMVVSAEVIEEAVTVLQEKLPETLAKLEELIAGYPPEMAVTPTDADIAWLASGINEKDADIVASAILAEVDWFVTGDKRLAQEILASGLQLAVVTPAQLLARIGE